MCTFSIIIPHKNTPHLLQRCLDSIPDISDVQVIVVDDNSQSSVVDFDHFPGLERTYTEFVFDKEGGGAGHARNIGLTLAKGRWVLFADSDDYFVPRFIDLLMPYTESENEVILFKIRSIYTDSMVATADFDNANHMIDDALQNRISAAQAILTIPGPVSKMFLREHLNKYHIKFDEIISSEDAMFVVKAVCWARCVAVSDSYVYTVTIRQDSLSRRAINDATHFLCKMNVCIRRNKFYDEGGYPFPRRPIIVQVIRAAQFGLPTFWSALKMTISEGALFSGLSTLFVKLKKTIII